MSRFQLLSLRSPTDKRGVAARLKLLTTLFVMLSRLMNMSLSPHMQNCSSNVGTLTRAGRKTVAFLVGIIVMTVTSSMHASGQPTPEAKSLFRSLGLPISVYIDMLSDMTDEPIWADPALHVTASLNLETECGRSLERQVKFAVDYLSKLTILRFRLTILEDRTSTAKFFVNVDDPKVWERPEPRVVLVQSQPDDTFVEGFGFTRNRLLTHLRFALSQGAESTCEEGRVLRLMFIYSAPRPIGFLDILDKYPVIRARFDDVMLVFYSTIYSRRENLTSSDLQWLRPILRDQLQQLK